MTMMTGASVEKVRGYNVYIPFADGAIKCGVIASVRESYV